MRLVFTADQRALWTLLESNYGCGKVFGNFGKGGFKGIGFLNRLV